MMLSHLNSLSMTTKVRGSDKRRHTQIFFSVSVRNAKQIANLFLYHGTQINADTCSFFLVSAFGMQNKFAICFFITGRRFFLINGSHQSEFPSLSASDASAGSLTEGSEVGRLKTPFSAIIFCPVSGPCETDCPACRALTLRLCAFAGFRGDMFFPGALKRIGSDMGGQKSGQRKSANLDGLGQRGRFP